MSKERSFVGGTVWIETEQGKVAMPAEKALGLALDVGMQTVGQIIINKLLLIHASEKTKRIIEEESHHY